MNVSTEPDQLIVQLTKREALQAFRRKLCVPVESITSIEWLPEFKDWPKQLWRAPGSYLPGVVMAGSYYTNDGWDFVFAHKPKGWTKPTLHNVLVITTTKRRYRRIILSMSESEASQVVAWKK